MEDFFKICKYVISIIVFLLIIFSIVCAFRVQPLVGCITMVGWLAFIRVVGVIWIKRHSDDNK